MKLGEILKKAGGFALKTISPGASQVIDAVNSLLPRNQQVNDNATGDDIKKIIDSLPDDQKAEVLSREIDLEIVKVQETHDTLRTMLISDATTAHTTRPKIALIMAFLVCFITVSVLLIFAFGVIKGKADIVTAIVDGWPFLLALLGIPGALLKGYFGILAQESANKLAAANGQHVEAFAGALKIAGKVFNK